jgi:hypothetical protein
MFPFHAFMMFLCSNDVATMITNKDVNVMAWASNFPFMLDVLAISPCPAD